MGTIFLILFLSNSFSQHSTEVPDDVGEKDSPKGPNTKFIIQLVVQISIDVKTTYYLSIKHIILDIHAIIDFL